MKKYYGKMVIIFALSFALAAFGLYTLDVSADLPFWRTAIGLGLIFMSVNVFNSFFRDF